MNEVGARASLRQSRRNNLSRSRKGRKHKGGRTYCGVEEGEEGEQGRRKARDGGRPA